MSNCFLTAVQQGQRYPQQVVTAVKGSFYPESNIPGRGRSWDSYLCEERQAIIDCYHEASPLFMRDCLLFWDCVINA